MRKIKNILILAGGDSTRFWPLNKKGYSSFLGKPLLLHLLDNIKQFAEKIIVVINTQDVQAINQFYPDTLEIVLQKKELQGQAGAILSAKNKIFGEVLILNAEDIFNYKILYRYIDITISSAPDCLLLAKEVKDYFPGGYFKFRDNKIEAIIEKPKPSQIPSNKVRLVVDYFRSFDRLIQTLEKIKTSKDDLYESGINQLIKENIKVDYLLYDSYWYVLKYPWHVLKMMFFFLDRNKNKEIKIGKNVKIAKTAKIVGPCFIDDYTTVGDFSLIRQSHIGKNCLIGGYSEVTRSYLSDGICLHRNYVGDSVLDSNVQMGAGSSTANFRFDEQPVKSLINGKKIDTGSLKLGAIIGKDAKIGVNATLLPGVKIGRNTFIGPGEIVDEDVKDQMFVLKGKVSKNMMPIYK